MSIMAQNLLKTPLQKWVTSLYAWLVALIQQHVSPRTFVARRRLRAGWRGLCGREAYRVARYLPDEESVDWQCRMAVALGGSDRALIVAQFIRWIDYNKAEGRAATTHNGYGDWIKRHFWHLKPGAFGGHIRALEKMGVLTTERIGRATPQGPYDQRKSYRIDRMRLNALLAAVQEPVSGPETGDRDSKTGKSKAKGAHSNLNNDSNSSNQSSNQSLKPNSVTQDKPTNQGRGGRRAGAGRKPKPRETVTELPQTPDSDSHVSNAELVGQSKGAGDSDFAAPHPRSAAPFSPGEAEVLRRLADVGLDEGKAAALMAAYGENRVRAVVQRCEERLKPDSREQKIDRPAGWIIRELENDIFKLGERAYRPSLSEIGANAWIDADFEDDIPESEPLPECPAVDATACERWAAAVAAMEGPLDVKGPAVFSNTVGHARLVGYDADTATYRVVTWIPPLWGRYMDVIQPALDQAHGGPATIELEVRA